MNPTAQKQTPALTPAGQEGTHTPTPYAVLDGAIVSDKLNDYGNWIVASCNRERTKQDDATLVFIVTACNSHAALVAALENLDTVAGRYQALVHTDGATKAHAALMEAHKQARAALASTRATR